MTFSCVFPPNITHGDLEPSLFFERILCIANQAFGSRILCVVIWCQLFCSRNLGVQVSLGPMLYRAGGPLPMIQMGVLCLQFTPFKDIVAGGGDGTVNLIRIPSFKNVKKVKLQGQVTSLSMCPGKGAKGSFEVYAGTAMAQIYLVKYDGAKNTMTAVLIQRSHFNKINDIAFPANYSDLFCTASTNDMRLWTLKEMKEILRIEVANVECEQKDSLNQECLCCAFMPDGKTIISGWTDGRIRAYAPQTGKLQYTIINAHAKMGAFKGSDNTVMFRVCSGGGFAWRQECISIDVRSPSDTPFLWNTEMLSGCNVYCANVGQFAHHQRRCYGGGKWNPSVILHNVYDC